MTSPIELVKKTEASLIREFFQESVGKWSSERRFYTLPDGETKEFESAIAVRFLEAGCDELLHLAQIHDLASEKILICGSHVTWESTNLVTGKKQSQGETVFGASENRLYRDRGYDTETPVTAEYYCPNAKTLCLRTKYNDSVFEEELKLIGEKYRTRQTVKTHAGEEIMIGQGLEKRIEG